MRVSSRVFGAVALAICASTFVGRVAAQATGYITGQNAAGVTQELALNRYPGLYTGNFGDCLGGQSLFNITKFDAAYYADNLTVLFHLDGSTNIKNESLMMYISVVAYGSTKFEMTFDPCLLNIYSLCPLNASDPIEGWATIPVGPAQVGGIIPIAFSLPDLEGYARLQIFANSTQTEIGCFQAVMTNGNTFSQVQGLSPVLAFLAAIAIVSSFATAAYGISIPHMRTHFAHSLSVFIVFETYQSIFLSGTLSLEWPSMLVSWWANFAWACGLIYEQRVVDSINNFVGIRGNGSQVGGASSAVIDTSGGLAAQIYGRNLRTEWVRSAELPNLLARDAYNASDVYDYNWAGGPVLPGLPLPGTWSNFAGDLSSVGIPVQSAFLVALVWFVVALALLVLSLLAFKGLLELFARRKWIKQDRLSYFRSNYRKYIEAAVLRLFHVAFFTMTTLALVQLTLKGSQGGPLAIAAIVFVSFLFGLGGVIGYACYTRLNDGRYTVVADRITLVQKKLFKAIPIVIATRESTLKRQQSKLKPFTSMPFFRVRFVDNNPNRTSVHQDTAYITRFGWLSARFRRTRWWFFSYYFTYLFIKSLFIGAAGSSPMAQVICVFVIELVGFVVIAKVNPFEGARNTAIAVWMLSISKVVTAGISIAFLPSFGLDRIIATVLGVFIIVVQGLVVVALTILIALGAISSYMSLTRNRENFWPEELDPFRVHFFEKVQARAADKREPPKPKVDKKKKKLEEEAAQVPKEPTFAVNSVRRAPKIEDEDGDVVADLDAAHDGAAMLSHEHHRSLSHTMSSRPASIVSARYSNGSLPSRARAHRASWSSRDFAQWEGQLDRPDSVLAHRLSSSSMNVLAAAGAGASATPASQRTGRAPIKPLAPLNIPEPDSSSSEERPEAAAGSPASASHPNTPMSPVLVSTPSRERLARHAEERMTKPRPAPASPVGEAENEE